MKQRITNLNDFSKSQINEAVQIPTKYVLCDNFTKTASFGCTVNGEIFYLIEFSSDIEELKTSMNANKQLFNKNGYKYCIIETKSSKNSIFPIVDAYVMGRIETV